MKTEFINLLFFFRQAKLDMRVAVAKVEELTKVTEDLQGQMQKKVFLISKITNCL